MKLSLEMGDGILSVTNPNITNIQNELEKMKNSAIEIGRNLSFMQQDIENLGKRYTIAELGKEIFGFSKSSTFNYIKVYKQFGQDNKYQEYSYTQLVEMSSMNKELRDQVTPDMSQRDIKKLKSDYDYEDTSSVLSKRLENDDVMKGQMIVDVAGDVIGTSDVEKIETVDLSRIFDLKVSTKDRRAVKEKLNELKHLYYRVEGFLNDFDQSGAHKAICIANNELEKFISSI